MEYVDGTPVDVYCEREKLSIELRCEIFRKICEAVTRTHRNLVLHRDIKPGNILVPAEGSPLLLDFGIAKLIDETAQNDRTHTAGTWILTPDYASPEEILGRPTTTATDVYSLGIVFYQLFTGVKPYRTDSTTPAELVRTICDQRPSRPSLAGANRRLAGDLDNIVLMALRKEPERRYSSVEQFSEDVRRYLRGLPVLAREDTLGYRAHKFVQRNRVGVVAASLTTACMVASPGIPHMKRAARNRRAAWPSPARRGGFRTPERGNGASHGKPRARYRRAPRHRSGGRKTEGRKTSGRHAGTREDLSL